MPLASLSLDLDNEWSYLKTRGEESWRTLPSYLDVVVPRVLEFFDERALRITVFVVGQDAAEEKNEKALALLRDSGHEIGNHSFRHEPWLHRYDATELEEEIERAENAIADATGTRPDGFRGPGYSLSEDVLRVLTRRGYRYDASTFPTFIGPLARAFYFRRTRFSGEAADERAQLFGSLRDGLQPLRPYRWRTDAGTILEMPVTTFPVVRTPIHLSYVIFLARRSRPLARAYVRAALTACRLTRTEPSILLHPLDFLDGDDVATLSFFPGMDVPASMKIEVVSEVVAMLRDRYDVVPVGAHADAWSARGLRERTPRAEAS
jgi:hypothetical protein